MRYLVNRIKVGPYYTVIEPTLVHVDELFGQEEVIEEISGEKNVILLRGHNDQTVQYILDGTVIVGSKVR